MKALRVLIVEDDPMLGLLFTEMFEAMGHVVCAIETSETEAVASAARFNPDLMIVDAHLETGNGVCAVEQILQTGFIPHIFITGNVAKLGALGPAAVVLEKPFTEAGLTRAIEQALDANAAPCAQIVG